MNYPDIAITKSFSIFPFLKNPSHIHFFLFKMILSKTSLSNQRISNLVTATLACYNQKNDKYTALPQ